MRVLEFGRMKDDHLEFWDILNTVGRGAMHGLCTTLPMLHDSEPAAVRFAKQQ